MTKVVNLKYEKCDIYIGRSRKDKFHYGNPFSHLKIPNTIHVLDRNHSVQCFKDWLHGDAFRNVEPERREWILDHIKELKDKKLGCFCSPQKCHGDILKELVDLI